MQRLLALRENTVMTLIMLAVLVLDMAAVAAVLFIGR